MKKNPKPLKSAVIALIIFTLVAFVAWVVFFVIFGLKEGILPNHVIQTLLMFLLPNRINSYLALSVGVLLIVFYIFIVFALTLLFSIIKRRGLMILPYFMVLFTGIAMMELVANLCKGNLMVSDITKGVGYLYYLTDTTGEGGVTISTKVMAICVLLFAVIGFVLAFITFLLSLIHTCKYPNTAHPRVDDRLDETKVEVEDMPADVDKFLDEPEPERMPLSEERELLLTIKEMIRDELRGVQQPVAPAPTPAPNTNTNTVTGATFAAPLVVQYFNGDSPVKEPAVVEKKPEEPAPAPAPVLEEVVEPELIPDDYEAPAPAPVVEEPAPAPVAEPAPAPVAVEPAPEPVPAPVPEPVPEPVAEKPKIIRIPFEERITTADKEMKNNYNELKNEIMAYGVHSRVSNSGDTFRLHRKTYVKLTIAGKSLKLYFALNPEDYKDSTLPISDASEKNIYSEIPLVFKVKSGLSMRRAKQLIADVMAPDGLVQGEVGKVNWVKEIAVAMKENRKPSSDDED